MMRACVLPGFLAMCLFTCATSVRLNNGDVSDYVGPRSHKKRSASPRKSRATGKKSRSRSASSAIRSRGFSLDSSDSSIARQVIGKSFDLKNSDFWTWKHLRQFQVFAKSMPDSCFEEMAVCPHSRDVGVKDFDDFSSMEKHAASTFGIDFGLKGGYKGISGGGGFHMNLHKEGKNQANTSKHFYKMWAKLSQKCFELSSSCLRNGAYLDDSLSQRLKGMPVGSDDLSTMNRWAKYFVRLYGSHVAIQSTHGASIEVVISRSGDCHFDMSEHGHDWGANLSVKAMDYVDAKIALNGSGNRSANSQGCKKSTDVKCSVLGGKQQGWPCPTATDDGFSPVSAQEIDDFLTGDTSEDWAQKTYSYKFKELSQMLIDMDYSWVNHAETLQQAVEYYACDAPRKWMLDKTACSKIEYKATSRLLKDQGEALNEYPGTDLDSCKKLCDDHPLCKSFKWGEKGRRKRRKPYCTLQASYVTGYEPLIDPPKKRSPDFGFKNYYKNCDAQNDLKGFNHHCGCTLKCLNGGELDETECKCKCQGDAAQGWTGRDCSVSYGRCQAGPLTHLPERAAQCAIDGMCVGGPGIKRACGPSEVCCIAGGLAGMQSKCCPFGNSCNCGSYRCECIPPSTSRGLSLNETNQLADLDDPNSLDYDGED